MSIGLWIFASMALFSIGVLGVLLVRNALVFFLSIELMLNAANLLFVVFSNSWGNMTGWMWVFFVLVVAAAEAAVGLAIMIHLFRFNRQVDLDRFNLLRE